jgi:N utilization substance protein A
VDSPEKIMEMVVEDSQLSLAIGKKGQNVRLASKLIGWRIDIKSEEEKRAEVESQMAMLQETLPTPLQTMSGLGLTPSLVQKLEAAGIDTVEQLANLSPEDLQNIPGIGEKTIEKISDALSEFYTQSPAYQENMERLAQQALFSKDEPAPQEPESAAENVPEE